MINIDKNVWGPLLWSIMHIAAVKYRYNSQSNFNKMFFKVYVPTLIPCNECLKHYSSYINAENISPTKFEVSLYKFHDSVSKRMGKKTNSNYNSYHREYSKYGYTQIILLSNKLKNYYYNLGYINMGNNVENFINFVNLNFYEL